MTVVLDHHDSLRTVLDRDRHGEARALRRDVFGDARAGERPQRRLAGLSFVSAARLEQPVRAAEPHPRVRRAGETGGALLERDDDRVALQRRREAAAGLEELEQPLALLLLRAEEPCVVDGCARHLRDRIEKLDLLGREAPLGVRDREPQDAPLLSGGAQRDAQAALLAPRLHHVSPVAEQVRVRDVLLYRARRLQDPALAGAVGQLVPRPQRVVGDVARQVLRDVRGAVDDRVVMRTVLVHGRVGHVRHVHREPRDPREHLVQVDRRGEGAAGVEQRREAPRLLLLPAEEARVPQRGGRRPGQQAEQVLLLLGEPAVAPALDDAEDAQRLAAEDERHLHDRLLLVLHHDLALPRVEVGIVHVLLEQVALAEHRVALGPVVEAHDRADVVDVHAAQVLGPHRRVRERPRHGIPLVDVAPLHVQRLSHLAGDRLDHLVEVQRDGQRGADLQHGRIRVAGGRHGDVEGLSHRRPPPGSCRGAWRGTGPCRRCARAPPGHRRRRGSRRRRR